MFAIAFPRSRLLIAAGIMILSFMNPAAIQAQGISADFSAGSVKIGIDNDGCDASKEGAIRYYSVASLHQFCDGIGWAGFFANPPSVALGITPGSNLSMDVMGPGSPAYGTSQTFTVRNFGKNPSELLTVSFTGDAGNFDITADTCTGNSLGEAQTCDITIRPKASDNGAYSATLTIPHDNAPVAVLRGIGTHFGCIPGDAGGGGIYASCSGPYSLVTTPGGCNNSATPTCPGTTDSLQLAWGGNGFLRDYTSYNQDGPQNSINLMQYVAQEGATTHPAIEYCMNMTYGGYSDWYLPALDEVRVLYDVKDLIGGWNGATSYISSTQTNSTQRYGIDTSGAINPAYSKLTATTVRCVRRETEALPPPQYDTTPDPVYFTAQMTTAANRVTSNAVTIANVSQDVNVSLENDSSGGARIKINGGAEVVSGSAGSGDTVEVVMTSPGAAGNANTVEVVLGGYKTLWKVGTPNATGTRKIFVSDTVQGNFGNPIQADSLCQNEATIAGLGGRWIALVSDGTTYKEFAPTRMDFNWATLVNTNGQTVANGWGDLWDGTISNAIQYDENGTLISSNTRVYSGTFGTGIVTAATTHCLGWATNSSSWTAQAGLLTATDSNWIANGTINCATTARLYCFEQEAGPPDYTPISVEFNPMTAQGAVSATDITSATVSVTGIDDGAPISISGGGTPEYRINGGAWTTVAGTINDGDTLTIRADAPAVAGQRNHVVVTIGTSNFDWYVGAANTANTARIFVRSTVTSGTESVGDSDSSCSTIAASRGMGVNWQALKSDASVPDYAINRINVNWGTLVNLNGDTVATSWNDLWDGTINSQIRYDESGSFLAVLVRTGTLSNGRASSFTCNNWTTSSSSVQGTVGSSNVVNSTWTDSTNAVCSSNYSVYCIESAQNPPDITPTAFEYNPMTTQAAASTTDVNSATVTITGISTSVPVSVSGAGNPEYRINAGAWTSVAGTINNGDTLTIRADAPSVANNRNKVTVTVGNYSTRWFVGAGNAANIKRIFISSTGSNGIMGGTGGVGGADALCASAANAAGLGTGWAALISDSTEEQYAVNRAPLNWGTLRNMNGVTVATSWNDLWDGTLATAINRNELNLSTSANVWTASQSNGRFKPSNSCYDWTTSTTSNNVVTGYGVSSSTSGTWLNTGNSNCNNAFRVYCIEK